MIVVADTGPLNYLIRLERVDLLLRLYGRVIIPRGVIEEMLHAGAPVDVRLWASALPPWAEPANVSYPVTSLPPWLGIGESEAIILAEELSADLVLMDEYRGRRIAMERGLKVGGTLSVLASGARLRLLDFNVTVEKLRGLGFRVSEQLVREMADEFRS